MQNRQATLSERRYKGLDEAPKYISRTCTLNYQRDYSFKTDRRVSIITLQGRIVVPYDGYSKHLDLIANGARIGAAKIVYQRSSKIYYLGFSELRWSSDTSPHALRYPAQCRVVDKTELTGSPVETLTHPASSPHTD